MSGESGSDYVISRPSVRSGAVGPSAGSYPLVTWSPAEAPVGIGAADEEVATSVATQGVVAVLPREPIGLGAALDVARAVVVTAATSTTTHSVGVDGQ